MCFGYVKLSMPDQSFSMNVNDVLELDYLVKEISRDEVTVNKNPNGSNVSYISKEVSVFDPNGTGKYEIEINGQIIEIDVYEVPDSGVSHWTFEQNLNDFWNTNATYNGTGSGNITYSTDAKNRNYSLDLNGSDAYVKLDTDIGLSTSGPFSIASWVKMNETPDRATLLSGFGSGSNGTSFDIELDCYTNRNGTNTFGVHTWSGYVTSRNDIIPSQGNWGHYVVTYSGGTLDGNNISLYLNGSELSIEYVDTNSNNLSTGSENFEIGYASKNTSNIDLNAMNVDSLRTYDKVLTATEVSNLYNDGSI